MHKRTMALGLAVVLAMIGGAGRADDAKEDATKESRHAAEAAALAKLNLTAASVTACIQEFLDWDLHLHGDYLLFVDEGGPVMKLNVGKIHDAFKDEKGGYGAWVSATSAAGKKHTYDFMFWVVPDDHCPGTIRVGAFDPVKTDGKAEYELKLTPLP